VQMGSDITGAANYDYLRYYGCVSITNDGLTVAVGWPFTQGGTWRGVVRVYNHDSTIDAWNQIGSDLVGDNYLDEFSETALSSDGTYLVGASYYGDYLKLFAKIGSNYEMIGEKLPSGEGGSFGVSSVDISADGKEVAIGDSVCG